MNVIIVDDSVLIRDQLKELFLDYPEILVVADTDDIGEAVVISGKICVDFFIIDISMSKGSGFELLKYVKKYNSRAKVIMLTNDSNDSYHSFALKLGVDFFFDKANEFTKLPDAILSTNKGQSGRAPEFVFVERESKSVVHKKHIQ